MANYLTFGSVSSSTYNIYISGEGVFNAPSKRGDLISIPGRNGDLFIDYGNFENIEVTYPAYYYGANLSTFATNLANFRNALASQKGYQTLTDTFQSTEYRMALFKDGIEINPVMYNTAATFDITFYCKPQRFLTSGQTQTTLTANTNVTINNPTPFEACPIFELSSGTNGGTITINGVDITIAATGSSATVYLDTETGEAYSSTGANLNQYISIPGNEFPKLAPGNNTVKYTRSSGTATCKIKPNYWRI